MGCGRKRIAKLGIEIVDVCTHRRRRQHRGQGRLSNYLGENWSMMSYEKLEVNQCSIQTLARIVKISKDLTKLFR